MKTFIYRVFIKVWLLSAVCLGLFAKVDKFKNVNDIHPETVDSKNQFALIGGGCFWCTEAVFEQIDGIISVISGYAGGQTENPSYKDICTGKSGHAEVIKIHFDPSKVSFARILEIFGNAHDPTTLNRQGADVGTQYRSAIYYFTEMQKAIATKSLDYLQSKIGDKKIVTEITEAGDFWIAEEYHQKYFEKHRINH